MTLSIAALEPWLYDWLKSNADNIPPRWKRWLAMYYADARIRKLFWQLTFVEMGEGTYANPGMIVVDDYTSGECLLSIGDRVSIGPYATFVAYSMPNNSPVMQAHPYIKESLIERAKIIIENDAWIGAHVTILPGVKIGQCAVVGAGAVVTKDVLPFSIVAGVPARFIRDISISGKTEQQQ
jgi:maltose O-acetyltransferase